MKWISVKDRLPKQNEFIIVTDGKNIGYMDWPDEYFMEQSMEGYINGIPDSNSFAMIGKDITHWFQIDDIPKPEDAE